MHIFSAEPSTSSTQVTTTIKTDNVTQKDIVGNNDLMTAKSVECLTAIEHQKVQPSPSSGDTTQVNAIESGCYEGRCSKQKAIHYLYSGALFNDFEPGSRAKKAEETENTPTTAKSAQTKETANENDSNVVSVEKKKKTDAGFGHEGAVFNDYGAPRAEPERAYYSTSGIQLTQSTEMLTSTGSQLLTTEPSRYLVL
jgi:hypothetical protein